MFLDSRHFKVSALDHPGGADGDLGGGKDVLPDHGPDGGDADLKLSGGSGYGHPGAVGILSAYGDAVALPEVFDAGLVPVVAGAGAAALTVEDGGDVLVGLGARQLPDQLDNIALRGLAVAAGLVFAHAQFRVDSPPPSAGAFPPGCCHD